MIRMRPQFALVLGLTGLLWLPVKSSGQEGPAPEQATQPAPADLANMPSGQVAVTYGNGELRIVAKNVPLRAVLQRVCTQIGVALDFSPAAVDQPIFADLGPGPAKKIIASLLNESEFNYALASSADDSNGLASLTVFPKTKDSSARDGSAEGAQSRVAQKQPSQSDVSPPHGAPVGKDPRAQQMKELLAQAQAEMANSGAENADAATVLKLVETQITAMGDSAATYANSSDTGQQEGAMAPQNPVGRARHRRR
jgi:hypothetical protein